MITVPHFDNEADEAEWWSKNQELVADEFERVKPKIGLSRLMRMRAAAAAEQPEDARETPHLSKLPRSA